MVSIKDYAINKGVSTQAVYKQLKTHEKVLTGHIQKVKGTRYLDDEAVAYLNNQSDKTPSVFVQNNNTERVVELEDENKRLLIKIAELQEIVIQKSERIEMLQESTIKLLEAKTDKPKKKWWNKKGI